MNNKYVLNSELEFRKNVILRSEAVHKICIFEDDLEGYIYFYCYFIDGLYISTKECIRDDFEEYRNIYTFLANELGFHVCYETTDAKYLKIKRI